MEVLDADSSNFLAADQVQVLGRSSEDQVQIREEANVFLEERINFFRILHTKRAGIEDNAHLLLRNWLRSLENHNYLWLSLIFPRLEKSASLPADDLYQVINTLPLTTMESYEKIPRECSNPVKARTILQAVVAASAPLTIEQVNIILSLRNDRRKLESNMCISQKCLAETLQELCGFFINIIDGRVHLIHQSAREFLLNPQRAPTHEPGSWSWRYSIDLEEADGLLARLCIQYLRLSAFEEAPLKVEDDFLFYNRSADLHGFHAADFDSTQSKISLYLEKHPFLEYAAQCWLLRFQFTSASKTERYLCSAIKLCEVETKPWRTWFAAYRYKTLRSTPSCLRLNTTLLFVSWIGFTAGVQDLLRRHGFSVSEKLRSVAWDPKEDIEASQNCSWSGTFLSETAETCRGYGRGSGKYGRIAPKFSSGLS